LVSLSGYLYGAKPLIVGVNFSTAMALHTTLTFILSSLSILFFTNSGLMDLITSKSSGGKMLRNILPIAIILPIILGYLKIKFTSLGIINNEMSVALVALFNGIFVSTYIFILAGLIIKENSKREDLEGSLRNSEAKYRTMFTNASEGIIAADLQTKQIHIRKKNYCS
jgi:PAS domain-containing protein